MKITRKLFQQSLKQLLCFSKRKAQRKSSPPRTLNKVNFKVQKVHFTKGNTKQRTENFHKKPSFSRQTLNQQRETKKNRKKRKTFIPNGIYPF